MYDFYGNCMMDSLKCYFKLYHEFKDILSPSITPNKEEQNKQDTMDLVLQLFEI